MEDLDLIVLGSGPGGYVAALRAAELGLSTTVVEREPVLGGTCLHKGCIPTKALLHTAEVLDTVRRADRFGVDVTEPSLDFGRTHSYKREVIDRNAKGIAHLFRRAGVETVEGRGRLLPDGAVLVERGADTETLAAKNVLLATGSTPQALSLAPVDGERILDSDGILEIDHVPGRLAVLGAGAVGVEFASIFASFGSEVSLIEVLPRILPVEDEDVSQGLERALRRRGIRILTNTKATSVARVGNGVAVALDQEGTEARLEVDVLLVAVGRRPRTTDPGLAEAGIELDERGFVKVDELMRTHRKGVYAVGDIVATPQLAHLASAEGLVAVEDMAGSAPRPIDYDLVPSCTYCEPQAASIGLTEKEARRRFDDVDTAQVSFAASGKANLLGRRDGFVKLVRESATDQLLGVHILGAEATELIGEASVALGLESTTEELFRAIHPHPTLSESIMEAARSLPRV